MLDIAISCPRFVAFFMHPTEWPLEWIDKRHTLRYLFHVDKNFEWNQEKNHLLIRERGISFEAVVAHMEAGGLITIVPGQGKFRHQKQFIVAVNQYIYIVPYVEDEGKIFLKTIIPSRKLTKQYLIGED